MKKALVLGTTGQDGSYITELLLKKKYISSHQTEIVYKKLIFLITRIFIGGDNMFTVGSYTSLARFDCN